jgi:hypothetical protein
MKVELQFRSTDCGKGSIFKPIRPNSIDYHYLVISKTTNTGIELQSLLKAKQLEGRTFISRKLQHVTFNLLG